jgi:hypothetical protein
MRVYVVNEVTGNTTLAAVGSDKANGGGRYFTYAAARPSPFPPEIPTLPIEGANKEACIRWIRDACLGIRMCANPPRAQHVHVAGAGAGKPSHWSAAASSGLPSQSSRGGGAADSSECAAWGSGDTKGGGGSQQFKKSKKKKGGGRKDAALLPRKPAAALGNICRGRERSGGSAGAGKFHDDAVPTVLCASPGSSDGVVRYVSYSETQDTLNDGRRARLFYLLTGSGARDKDGTSSAPRLLAVYGEETLKKDKHYRYSVSQEVYPPTHTLRLSPAFCTLHHTPFILDHTPFTLNPKPFTLHPNPFTLHL